MGKKRNYAKNVRRNKMIRHYWEVLFSTEYFPYWEFTMLMMLGMLLSILWRLNRIENKIDEAQKYLDSILDDVDKI
jgi:hypothetical protein